MNSYRSNVIVAILICAVVIVGLVMMSRPMRFIFWGFATPGLLALWGLALLARGIRGDTLDESGIPSASRAWLVISGALLQVPLMGYALFAWRQGFFGH